jgi:hypothetical protein
MSETKTTVDPFKLGYLEDKKITLMPSPRGANMGVKEKTHLAYFQIEHGSTFFSLPRTERGDLVKVFKNDDERKWFEETLGLDLNISKPGNYFETFDIKVTKDSVLMYKGETYDMADPMDNLRVRVLKWQPVIAPSEEKRLERPEYKWYLVDQDNIVKKQAVEYDSIVEFGMFLGKLGDNLDKKKNVLKVYFSSINSTEKITPDTTEQMVKSKFNQISKDISTRDEFLKIVEDPLFDDKIFVLDAVDAGAIFKDGKDTYSFTGEEETYTFDGISRYISKLKDEQDDIYFTIMDRIKKHKK